MFEDSELLPGFLSDLNAGIHNESLTTERTSEWLRAAFCCWTEDGVDRAKGEMSDAAVTGWWVFCYSHSHDNSLSSATEGQNRPLKVWKLYILASHTFIKSGCFPKIELQENENVTFINKQYQYSIFMMSSYGNMTSRINTHQLQSCFYKILILVPNQYICAYMCRLNLSLLVVAVWILLSVVTRYGQKYVDSFKFKIQLILL